MFWTKTIDSFLVHVAALFGRRAQPGRRGGFGVALAGLCLLLVLHSVATAQTDRRRVYDLGTSTTDRVSHPLGVTLAALVKLKLLPTSNIDLNALNTEGSARNAVYLRQGDLDFAILNKMDAYDAAHGKGPFVTDGPDPNLRHVTNLWTSTFHFVVKAEFAPTGTLTDFLNLGGRRIALGENGSATLDQARALFGAFDIDIEEHYALADLGGERAIDAFLGGELDGFLLADEGQGAEITAFFEEAGDTAISLSVDDDDIDTINAGGAPAWVKVPLSDTFASSSNGESAVIGMHNILSVGEQVPEGVVYQITKTVFDNLPFLQEMHAAAESIRLEHALDQIVLPVHTGARAYYNEVGVAVPEPEPVRISTLSKSPFLTRYDSVQAARQALNDGTITVLGGEAGQTLTRMIDELAASLDDTGIRVIGMTNPRPADSIADVLYARGVDSAVVPLDILDYALRENVYPGLQGKITYATEFFSEEVHLIASEAIDRLDDLVDKPVNLGPKGSTTAFTAAFLLDRLNVPVEPTYHDQRTALALLQQGELAAAFFISGKPMPLLTELPEDSGLHFLDIQALPGPAYRPATLSAEDYPALLAAGETIETFGVRTGLISYNWRSTNPRYDVLSNFLAAFFDQLPALKQTGAGRHPKWQEIDPAAEIDGWRRSPAAQRWLQSQGQPDEATDRADG